jgi:hypothetical protein
MMLLAARRSRRILVQTVWPLCFAFYMAMSALYGVGGVEHPLGDTVFDFVATLAVVLLAVTAVWPSILWVRTMAGLTIIGGTLVRAAWLVDPGFVPERLLTLSVIIIVCVSALGWVMAADFSVVANRETKLEKQR